MKKLLLIALISNAFYIPAQTSFTLEDAKKYASEHFFSVKNARFESELAKQDVNSIRSVGLPQLNAEGTFQNFINLPVSLVPADAFGFPDYLTQFLGGVSLATGVPLNTPAPTSEFNELRFGTNFNTTGGLTLNQLIFDGSYFYGLKAAKAYEEMNKIQENKTIDDVYNQVEKSYYMALIASENSRLLLESTNKIEDILKQTKALYNQGFLEEQDVDQLEYTLNTIKTSLNNAKNQYALTVYMLKFQMGYPLQDEIVLSTTLNELTKNTNNTLIQQELNIQSIPEYKLMIQREQLLMLNKKSEVSKAYPRLIGFVSHSENSFFNEFKIPNKWYPTTLWGLKLQVPIFSGGLYFAEVKKASIELERIKEAKKFTENSINVEYQASKTEFINALNELENAQKNLTLAEKIQQKTLVKFNEGIIASLELTQAQNQYLNAEGLYISSLLKVLIAKSNLQKLIK